MVKFLETHGLIRDSQPGFRKGRSCLTNLICFLHKVTSCLDAKGCMDIVLLDLANAFDKVPHKRLMKKVAKHGIGGKLHKLIEGWLGVKNKEFALNVLSSWQAVRKGSHKALCWALCCSTY